MKANVSRLCSAIVVLLVVCADAQSYSSGSTSSNSIAPLTPSCPTGVAGTVTVNGNGKSQAVADESEIGLRIAVQNRTADGARRIAGTFAEAVVTAVRGIAGIYPDNVTTDSVSVSPVSSRNQDNTYTTIGYTFTNSISISISNVSSDLLSQVLDTVVSRGGNNLTISSVDFSLSDKLSYNKTVEARRQAAQDARATATDYAEALGLSLGAVLTVTDTTYGATPIQQSNSLTRTLPTLSSSQAGSASDSGTPTTVSIGRQSVSASVTLIYTLCNPAS